MQVAYLSLVLWAAVAISLLEPTLRFMRGPYAEADALMTALFFAALLWAGGLGRLIFLPDVMAARTVVLILSCLVAAFILILRWQGRRK